MSWVQKEIDDAHVACLSAIEQGDERNAGIHAGHVACLVHAVGRVQKGVSVNLQSDPLYGRFFNITEYFLNPRTAGPQDDLGASI